MSTTKTTPSYQEPSHDEIALSAFLLWEKEGRQPGREMTYWLQAEGQIRALRQKKAEAAAAQAAIWERQSSAAQAKTAQAKSTTKTALKSVTKPALKAKLPAAAKLITTSARTTTVKPAPVTKAAPARPATRTAVRASR